MLSAAGLAALEALVGPDSRVLDVGGGARPWPRADWVVDLMAYDERAAMLGGTAGYGYGEADRRAERFGPDSWVQLDVCGPDPWPFEDDAFDVVVCSHTLEDVRDPVAVCRELVRVGRAGYVEVPSRLAEQALGAQAGPMAGWGHHRWLCDVDRGAPDGSRPPAITFLLKYHHLHHRPDLHFPAGFYAGLPAEDRVAWFTWEGTFAFRERIVLDPAVLEADLAGVVAAHRGRVPLPGAAGPRQGAARRLARRARRALQPDRRAST